MGTDNSLFYMTKITLHIGSYKTGSTAIQQFLKRNRSSLLDAGWSYPHAACRNDNAHHLLPFALQNGSRKNDFSEARELVNQVLAEARENGAENIILSSEVFFSLQELEIHRLAAILDDFEVRVVCYLRRQDLFLHSFYMQCIKEANVRLSDSPMDYVGFNKITDIAKYDQILNWWAQAFGDGAMCVETFEKSSMPNGVIPSFSELVGLAFLPTLHEKRLSNITIRTELIEYLRVINAIKISATDHIELLKSLNDLSLENAEIFSNHRFISPLQQRDVYSMYSNINANIRSQYFPERSSLFSVDEDEFIPNANWELPSLSTQSVARISAWLLFNGACEQSIYAKAA